MVFHRFCFSSSLLSSDMLCQFIHYPKSGMIKKKVRKCVASAYKRTVVFKWAAIWKRLDPDLFKWVKITPMCLVGYQKWANLDFKQSWFLSQYQPYLLFEIVTLYVSCCTSACVLHPTGVLTVLGLEFLSNRELLASIARVIWYVTWTRLHNRFNILLT